MNSMHDKRLKSQKTWKQDMSVKEKSLKKFSLYIGQEITTQKTGNEKPHQV